LRHIPQTHSSK
jgi:hypothetical protein